MPLPVSLKIDDTPPEVQVELLRRYMAVSPERRIKMAASLYDAARILVSASLPALLTGIERKIEIFRRFYASDFSPEECERICCHLLSTGPCSG